MSATVSLNPESIIDEAQRSTGLSDFGSWNFREPMARLLHSLDTEAQLHEIGRATHRQRILDILCTRLRFESYLNRYRDIADERIERPVFIVGLPRTGTTMLHRMLAADPRFYAAAWWETRFPVPLSDDDLSRTDDPRIAVAKAEVAAMLEHVPELAAIHPLDAEEADEEIMLLEQSFYSTGPESMANVAGFGQWLATQDQTEGYRYLKRLLQFLQWQKKQRGEVGQQWVLKSPHHVHCMDVLFKVFPDAHVIQTHRDPVETIPSLASFIYSLWRLGSDVADPAIAGRQWNDKMAAGLAHAMQVRDTLPAERFLDVHFSDTVSRPMDVLERIYHFLQLELTAAAREAIARYRDANRREQRAPHNYTLEQFALSTEQIQRNFSQYRSRYIKP
ncbi:MAG: sulfotransferase [Halioglobus sp.]|nr:sulfotransferase [Halioglobus sp.]